LRQNDLKDNYYILKMATLQQLKKQKQDLIDSYTQLSKDTSVPISDKISIMKDLSRAIANITDQISRMLPTPHKEEHKEERKEERIDTRKEEIKEIKKEKMELQPKTIPRTAEEGKWKMSEIVRVVTLDLGDIPELEVEEDGSIQWDKFASVVIPKLMEQIRTEMVKNGSNFPIVLQTTVKAVCTRLGPEKSTFYKNYRTKSMSNIRHVANNFEQLEKILRDHLNEIIEESSTSEGDSETGIIDS
jgi:hypothetical protein